MNNPLFFLFLSIFFFCNCKKGSNSIDVRPDVTNEYTNKLAGKWKIIAQNSNQSIDIDGNGIANTDIYAQWQSVDSCHYREIWEFKSDKSGSTKWSACTINNNTTSPANSWFFNWHLEDKGYLITINITSTIPASNIHSYQLHLSSVTDSLFIQQEQADYIQGNQIIHYIETTTYQKI